MSGQDILFRIYYLLKSRPHSVQALHTELLKAGIKISKRSVYRYIERLMGSLDIKTEILEMEEDNNNKHFFFIRSLQTPRLLSQNEWLLFLNNFFIFKTIFNLSQDEISLNERILNHSMSSIPLKAQKTSIINYSEQVISSTRFGELNLSNHQKRVLYKFMNYLAADSMIQIDQYSSLMKDNRFVPPIQSPLVPVDIMFHKGNYCLRVISLADRLLHSLEIEMVQSISYIPKEECYFEIEKLKQEIEHRFGYHLPLISGIHHVRLLFPPNPGEHIIHRKWHPSQSFTRLPNGYIEFEMSVEINIELIGWIGMWLENVQILAPPVLIEMMEDHVMSTLEVIRGKNGPVNNG